MDPYIDDELKSPETPPVVIEEGTRLLNELLAVQIDSEKLKLQRERNVDTMIQKFLGYDSE